MSADELDIKLQDARPRTVPEAPPPEQDPACAVRIAGYPDPDYLRVYLHEETLRAVEGMAASFPEREVGGVLLGRFAVHHDRPYVKVEQSIPGWKAEGSATQLTFTHETWQQITAVKDREYPDLQIVGWFHSHPDLGIFLSRDDLYIHRNFFANERQVALVVDPINRDRGLFVWHQGEVKRDGGLRIYGDADDLPLLEQYVGILHAPKAARPAEGAAPARASQQPVVVKLEFHDGSICPYALMPRSWREFFGVTDLRTAPRLSLKSLLIFVLIVIMLGMALQIRTLRHAAAPPPPAQSQTAPRWWQRLIGVFTHRQDEETQQKPAPRAPAAEDGGESGAGE
jgi:proteasome lid subunit RPN8/RPN11